MKTGNQQPYWLAKTNSLHFNNNCQFPNSPIKLFYKHYINENVKTNNWSNENHEETIIKNKKPDNVPDWKAKGRRFIIYRLNCLKLLRVYFVYSVLAVRMQFVCIRAWYVLFQRRNRPWKAITPSFQLQKGFLKA